MRRIGLEIIKFLNRIRINLWFLCGLLVYFILNLNGHLDAVALEKIVIAVLAYIGGVVTTLAQKDG